jgi:phage terminase large subunit
MGNDIHIQMPTPNPKQDLAFKEKHRYVGYGGARGGGKSWFVRWKAVLLCLNYPGIKILITRKTYRELLNNHITPLQLMLSGVAKYNKSDKCFIFPNRSSIWFGYCANDGDLGQYQGAEYDIWFADEAGQFPEEWLTSIDACVRGANSFPKRTYYTLNPGGPSHGYFKRLFIDRRFEENEYPEDYSFIQALVTDNKALMDTQPGYLRSLEKLPAKIRDAWLYGSWDVYQGQFFEEFADRPNHYEDRQWTHVIEPFEIPDSWKIYRSFDWGYNKPFSCGWWAVDHDGVAYRILELYGCTQNPNEGVKWHKYRVFNEIARIEREHRWLVGKNITGIADPACWNAETGESIADSAGKCGVYFSPGDNARLPGWMQVHYRLAFDDNGYPMLYIFRNCKAFIRTIPILQYDDHKPEDLNTAGEDHVADEVRYFCMSRPIKPTHTAVADAYASTPAALFLDIPKEDIRAVSRRPRMEVIDE